MAAGMRVTPPPSASPATTRWAGRTPSAAMGALEEAHLAAIAACGCDEEEDEEDLLAELGVGAAMLVVALATVSVVFAPAVTAQTGSYDDALPPELVGNYSGLACNPAWNNFVLRYAQGGENMLRVVLSAMYSSGWVGMSFSKDGLMVGSSAMVGWVGKTTTHVKQFALNGKAPSMVVADRGFLVSNNRDHTVPVNQAKIYLAFQLKFQSQLKQQQCVIGYAICSACHGMLLNKDKCHVCSITGGYNRCIVLLQHQIRVRH